MDQVWSVTIEGCDLKGTFLLSLQRLRHHPGEGSARKQESEFGDEKTKMSSHGSAALSLQL